MEVISNDEPRAQELGALYCDAWQGSAAGFPPPIRLHGLNAESSLKLILIPSWVFLRAKSQRAGNERSINNCKNEGKETHAEKQQHNTALRLLRWDAAEGREGDLFLMCMVG